MVRSVERTLRLFGTRLEQMGRGVPMMAAALSAYLAGTADRGRRRHSGGDELRRAIAMRYLPFAITIRMTNERRHALAGSLPFIAAMQPVNGASAVYVCRHFACRQPVTTVEALQQELETTG